jgi:hypothetical protein
MAFGRSAGDAGAIVNRSGFPEAGSSFVRGSRMPDEPIKARIARAIECAGKSLATEWKITFLKNHAFHLEALRKKEVRRIRIVLDKMTAEDEQIVRNEDLPEIFTKEIWIKRKNRKAFKVIEIS